MDTISVSSKCVSILPTSISSTTILSTISSTILSTRVLLTVSFFTNICFIGRLNNKKIALNIEGLQVSFHLPLEMIQVDKMGIEERKPVR